MSISMELPTGAEANNENSRAIVGSFDEYRDYCDAANSFRKLGILDEESYAMAIHDPTTVFCEIGGSLLPAAVSIEYEGGYDAQRIKALTGREKAMLLSIPFCEVRAGAVNDNTVYKNKTLPNEAALIIEEPRPTNHVATDQEHAATLRALTSLGALTAGEFLDMPSPAGHETAWMGLYSYPFGPSEKSMAKGPAAVSFEDAWLQRVNEEALPPERSTGTYLFTGEQLMQDPNLIDKLWAISEIGFGKVLGQNHPVSMEENKQFFNDHLLNADTYTAVHYDQGEPVCFGSLSIGLDGCEWLNHDGSETLKRELEDSETLGETPLFFSEVISNGKAGAAYSLEIFKLFIDITARTQRRYRLFFESTNRSSRYIPRGVQRAVEMSGLIEPLNISKQVDKVGHIDYWFATNG